MSSFGSSKLVGTFLLLGLVSAAYHNVTYPADPSDSSILYSQVQYDAFTYATSLTFIFSGAVSLYIIGTSQCENADWFMINFDGTNVPFECGPVWLNVNGLDPYRADGYIVELWVTGPEGSGALLLEEIASIVLTVPDTITTYASSQESTTPCSCLGTPTTSPDIPSSTTSATSLPSLIPSSSIVPAIFSSQSSSKTSALEPTGSLIPVSASDSSSSGHTHNTGKIVGAVIGSVVGVIVLVFLGLWLAGFFDSPKTRGASSNLSAAGPAPSRPDERPKLERARDN